VNAVAALFRRSFGTLTFLPTLHTPDEDRGYFRGVVADREVWVWDEGSSILGFAALADDELTHLYVDPDAQGRGIGGALMERAKERRPDGFQLWVFQQNANARRFYERRDFVLVRETDGSGNDELTPDSLYACSP